AANAFNGIDWHYIPMPLCLPACEHAVLGHRGVGRLAELRIVKRISPAAVGPLDRLQRLQQNVDLCLIFARVQLAEKYDGQPRAVDIVADRLPRLLAGRRLTAGLDGGHNLRMGLGLTALDEAKTDQAFPAEPTVGGRLKILEGLIDDGLHLRAIRRD